MGVSQVRNEIAVLKRVSMGHRNILTLVDYFETMNNRTSQEQIRAVACMLIYLQSISLQTSP